MGRFSAVWAFLALVSVGSAVASMKVARQQGRSPALWFVIGAVAPLVSIGAMMLLGRNAVREE